MTSYYYPTPAWLDACAEIYHNSPKFADQMKKITTKIYFRITAEPAWGIERDMIFGGVVEKGALLEMGFCSEDYAKSKADFILAATPQEWKRILKKEGKFNTEFLLGKVKLEQGSKVALVGIIPYSNLFIDALTQVELRFPDELAPQEKEVFCEELAKIRREKGI